MWFWPSNIAAFPADVHRCRPRCCFSASSHGVASWWIGHRGTIAACRAGAAPRLPPSPKASPRPMALYEASTGTCGAAPLGCVPLIPIVASRAETFFGIQDLNLDTANQVGDVGTKTGTGGSEFTPPHNGTPPAWWWVSLCVARPLPWGDEQRDLTCGHRNGRVAGVLTVAVLHRRMVVSFGACVGRWPLVLGPSCRRRSPGASRWSVTSASSSASADVAVPVRARRQRSSSRQARPGELTRWWMRRGTDSKRQQCLTCSTRSVRSCDRLCTRKAVCAQRAWSGS